MNMNHQIPDVQENYSSNRSERDFMYNKYSTQNSVIKSKESVKPRTTLYLNPKIKIEDPFKKTGKSSNYNKNLYTNSRSNTMNQPNKSNDEKKYNVDKNPVRRQETYDCVLSTNYSENPKDTQPSQIMKTETEEINTNLPKNLNQNIQSEILFSIQTLGDLLKAPKYDPFSLNNEEDKNKINNLKNLLENVSSQQQGKDTDTDPMNLIMSNNRIRRETFIDNTFNIKQHIINVPSVIKESETLFQDIHNHSDMRIKRYGILFDFINSNIKEITDIMNQKLEMDLQVIEEQSPKIMKSKGNTQNNTQNNTINNIQTQAQGTKSKVQSSQNVISLQGIQNKQISPKKVETTSPKGQNTFLFNAQNTEKTQKKQILQNLVSPRQQRLSALRNRLNIQNTPQFKTENINNVETQQQNISPKTMDSFRTPSQKLIDTLKSQKSPEDFQTIQSSPRDTPTKILNPVIPQKKNNLPLLLTDISYSFVDSSLGGEICNLPDQQMSFNIENEMSSMHFDDGKLDRTYCQFNEVVPFKLPGDLGDETCHIMETEKDELKNTM